MDIFFDFTSLWAAGRVVLKGGDPYQVSNIHLLLASSVRELTNTPGGFHNPIWTIPIFVVIGLFPYHLACLVWLICSIAPIIWIVRELFSIEFFNDKPTLLNLD